MAVNALFNTGFRDELGLDSILKTRLLYFVLAVMSFVFDFQH